MLDGCALTIGARGGTSSCMAEDVMLEELAKNPILRRFVSICSQSKHAVALALDAIREDGGRFDDYVVVLADVRHEATRLLLRDMAGEEPDGPANGQLRIVEKETAARVLRYCKVDAWADFLETPLASGKMRLMLSAEGKVQCFDLDALPPLPPAGEA